MCKRFPLVLSIACSLIWIMACTTSQKLTYASTKIQNQQEIDSLAKDLLKDISIIDTIRAKALISKQIDYANTYSKDSLAPEYLFRAADISRGIGNYKKAVQLLEQIHTKYPTYQNAPNALFLQGFIYDVHLKQANLAKNKLQEFIRLYPRHELFDNAKQMLKLIDNPLKFND